MFLTILTKMPFNESVSMRLIAIVFVCGFLIISTGVNAQEDRFNASVSVTPGTEVEPGQKVTLLFTVTNNGPGPYQDDENNGDGTGSYVGIIFRDSLPESWEVVDTYSDGGKWRRSHWRGAWRQVWAWDTYKNPFPEGSRNPSLTLSIPASASGTYRLHSDLFFGDDEVIKRGILVTIEVEEPQVEATPQQQATPPPKETRDPTKVVESIPWLEVFAVAFITVGLLSATILVVRSEKNS